MIEINLVPDNLRKRKRKKGGFHLNIPKEIVVGLVGGLFVILLLVHVMFQINIFMKYAEHKHLKQEWAELQPSKQRVDLVIGELRKVQGKISSIEKITGGEGIVWAKKYNDISDSLPRGVWLTRIAVDPQMLVVEGSAVSKTKGRDEMINVHQFASNLKNQAGFLDNLLDLDVGSIQRRKIRTVEIADFSITARIREEKKGKK